MRVETKICGLSTPEGIDAAVSGGAAYIGLVFFPKSPRNVSIDRAAALAAALPSHIEIVGVFVDPSAEFISEVCARVALSVVQLHGSEQPDFIQQIQRNHAVKIWKAIAVKTANDVATAARYRGTAHRILYDAKTPDDADLPGGMGLRFDWELLRGVTHPLPWAVSGGLHAGNVAEAARITGASLVDVSSGVERAPGIKDMDKIAAFLQAASQL